jgi:hypothetical protein
MLSPSRISQKIKLLKFSHMRAGLQNRWPADQFSQKQGKPVWSGFASSVKTDWWLKLKRFKFWENCNKNSLQNYIIYDEF